MRGIYSTIYTDTLENKDTAKIDLLEAQKRLERLRQAEPKGASERARIGQAIKQHEALIKRYSRIIEN